MLFRPCRHYQANPKNQEAIIQNQQTSCVLQPVGNRMQLPVQKEDRPVSFAPISCSIHCALRCAGLAMAVEGHNGTAPQLIPVSYSFYQEDDNFYYVIPYKQEQYLVDFERFVNVSRKLSKYVHANSEFLDLYNDKSFPSRDIFKIPFYSHDSTGIDIQPKVVAEFVNWINGADGDYRREDNRQAILVGHINEYMQLFALAMLYDIPALWNWCVKEVSCLPIEASEAHIAKRKYMNMGDLVHDQETYTYWPYTVPEGHYTRLPRACMNEGMAWNTLEPGQRC